MHMHRNVFMVQFALKYDGYNAEGSARCYGIVLGPDLQLAPFQRSADSQTAASAAVLASKLHHTHQLCVSLSWHVCLVYVVPYNSTILHRRQWQQRQGNYARRNGLQDAIL